MTMIVGDGCDNDDDVENGMIVVTVMITASIKMKLIMLDNQLPEHRTIET